MIAILVMMKKMNMIKINFNRDSVCMGDDIEDHNISFEVDEQMSIDDFVKFLYSNLNAIARISGGKATWILQIRFNEYYYRDIAIFAEQWKSVKCFDFYKTIGEIVKQYKPKYFYAKYLGQSDPEDVYNNLLKLRLGF